MSRKENRSGSHRFELENCRNGTGILDGFPKEVDAELDEIREIFLSTLGHGGQLSQSQDDPVTEQSPVADPNRWIQLSELNVGRGHQAMLVPIASPKNDWLLRCAHSQIAPFTGTDTHVLHDPSMS